MKKLFKKGYISIEYVIIGALVLMISMFGAPRIYHESSTLTNKKADATNSYIYTIDTSSNVINPTGGKHHTNTIVPDVETPIDPGDGEVRPNPGDGLIHPTGVSLWVEEQLTGGPIAETTSPITIELKPGDQIRVNGRVLPVNANNQAIRWVNYNTTTASANQNGLITAREPGDALIRVEAIDNNAFNEINVHVRHITATDFDIRPNKLTMTVGDVEEVSVKFYPENVTLKKCTFESQDTGLLTVEPVSDTEAILTAINAEKNNNKTSVVVTCQSQNMAEEPVEIKKTMDIEILGKMVNTEDIELNKTSIELEVGETFQILATVKPTNASVKELAYESLNDDIANVNVSGLITGIAVGETYVYVRNYGGDYYGKEIFNALKVTVKPKTVPIEGVDISYSQTEIPAGDAMSAIVKFTPENTTQTELIWTSSDPDILKVSNNGQVQGLEEGSAIITATSAVNPNIKDSFAITVTGKIVRVTGIKLIKRGDSLLVDDTMVVTATVEPDSAYNKNVIWSTNNNSVCTVNSGLITGISSGKCTITAKTEDGGYTDSVTIQITEVAVEKVNIEPTEVVIGIGESIQLSATVEPEDATRKGITWSYYELSSGEPQENIILLDDGFVSGIGYGTVIVKATAANGLFAEARVTVKEIIPTSIEMPEKITLNKGATYPIVATVLPTNAASKALSWSVANPNIATVNQGGLVTASDRLYGTTEVVATWTNGEITVTGRTIVEVLPTQPEMLEFNYNKYVVSTGEETYGTVTVLPATADFKDVTYEMLDETVAEIIDKGLTDDGLSHQFAIKGLKEGVTTLTAKTDNGITASVPVEVTFEEIIADNIYSDNSIIEIEIGESYAPVIKFIPETTTNKDLVWETEDSFIAAVSKDGVVTGISEGITYVNVQSVSNGSWYKFTVIVNGHTPQKISVTPAIMELNKFTETLQYEITILPSDSTDTGYYFEVYNSAGEDVTNENHLLVSMTGKDKGSVTGMKVGQYTVKFIVNGYPDVYDEMTVNVVQSPWDGETFVDTDMDIRNNTCYPEDGWHLAWIAYQANLGKLSDYCTVVSQQADIDLNNYTWTPIGVGNDMQAIYLGNGYKVKNLYVTGEDIFSKLKDGATDIVYDYGLFGKTVGQVVDVTVDGSYIRYTGYGLENGTGVTTYVGVLSGESNLISNITINDANISINSSTDEKIYAGSVSGSISK